MNPAGDNLLRRFDRTGLLLLVVRLVLAATFISMGANKIADPVLFLKSIRLYGLLPDTPGVYLNTTAILIPWLEVVAGTALLLGLNVRGASLGIVIMLSLFTPAILLHTAEIMRETGKAFTEVAFDCGCGTGVEIIWRKTLMNAGLLLLALTALFSGSRRFCATMWFERRKANSRFCHLCGYAVRGVPRVGLCRQCAEPPTLPNAVAEGAS